MRREKIQSSYYTTTEEAVRLLEIVDEVWGLDGKRVFEPAVGAGMIVQAAGPYSIEWVTNDMNPETSNFEPDYAEDIFTLSPDRVGPVDLAIGNPPFTGRIDGRNLAMAFLDRTFAFTHRVAFILPAHALRARFLSQISSDIHIVAHTPPRDSKYSVAEIGYGEEVKVRTVIILAEKRPSTHNGLVYDTSPVDGLEWLESYEEATHAVQHWGGTHVRALDGSYGRRDQYAKESPAQITDERIEAILLSPQLKHYLEDTSVSSPMCPADEINHLVRGMLSSIKGQ